MSALTSVVSGGQEAVVEDAAADLPFHKLDPAVDVEHLDICHLGHHKYAHPRSIQHTVASHVHSLS